ncbi:hypothetical protein GCM10009554_59470 [Kribbella koreensis]|uniref:M23ase beta-sheet core domain-containing protein n=1 Tax=Kribbella koreensis TaxID=57909 RepID=A0ABP4BS51_9ACTN
MTFTLLAAVALLAPATPTNPAPATALTAAAPAAITALATPATLPSWATPAPLPAWATPATLPAWATPAPAPPTAAPAQPAAVWPLSPRPEVVRGFAPPPKPWLPGHRGLDLRGSPGQQVRSATSGTVTYAGPLAGRGVIVIATGPLRTTYEPVIPTVRKGTQVTPGTPLGHLSAAASHCAPATCLHWGLLESTTYLNPLSLLPHHPVRLLPTTPADPNAPVPGPPAPRHDSAPIQATPPTAMPAELPPPRPTTPPTAQQPADSRIPRRQASPPAVEASPRGGFASSVVVGLAAAGTLIGSLLIRRH